MTTISFIQEAIPSKHLKDVAIIRLQEMGKCDLPQIQERENYPMLMAILQTSKCKTDTHSFQTRCKAMDMDDLRPSNRGVRNQARCRTMAMDGLRQLLQAVRRLAKNYVGMPELLQIQSVLTTS